MVKKRKPKRMGRDYLLSTELKTALQLEIEQNLGEEVKNIREENKRLVERNLELLKKFRKVRDEVLELREKNK